MWSNCLKPVISASPFVGNVVKVKFVRGNTGGARIETSVDRGPWTSHGNFFKSPAPLDISQNADSLPRHVQIRARYLGQHARRQRLGRRDGAEHSVRQ